MRTPARKNRANASSVYPLSGVLLKHFYWIFLALLAALLGAALLNFVLARL